MHEIEKNYEDIKVEMTGLKKAMPLYKIQMQMEKNCEQPEKSVMDSI